MRLLLMNRKEGSQTLLIILVEADFFPSEGSKGYHLVLGTVLLVLLWFKPTIYGKELAFLQTVKVCCFLVFTPYFGSPA